MKKSLLPAKKISGGTEKQVSGKEALVKLLRWHFGYSDFRGKQLEAIQAVLSGRDCFCLMPTGGGKSMCYQIPALAKTGIVLVVSPLIGNCFKLDLLFSNFTGSLDGKPSDGIEGERNCCGISLFDPNITCKK
ncbi:hypothetical protein SLEP1_g51362 [Rubroshorea leprosula]|uniref:DEAD/DEAH-box helicase domain-containing protein n=1 Tax=Rubroshorea leprosula TaxID=152421 RepID=A0AAV5M543_9ROSI|nr:hypothetical protein SLEP1_g51362 [Rubroshorea leprosula]